MADHRHITSSTLPGTRVSSFVVQQIAADFRRGYYVILLCDCGREIRRGLGNLNKGAPRCACRTTVNETVPAAILRLESCCSDERWKGLSEYRLFVSSCGRCFSVLQNRLIGSLGRYGYVIAYLHLNGRRVRMFVHRLILLGFTGPCPKDSPQTRHLDGNPTNNHLKNLRWGTPQDNTDDKYLHGTVPIGSHHHGAKLTESDIPVIRKLYGQGLSQRKIAELYSVQQMTVSNIIRGKIWKHV